MSPADGSRLETRRPTLVVGNPVATYAAAAALRVRFRVQDQAGATLHQSAPMEVGAGTTRYARFPIELPHDQSFRWSATVIWNDMTGGILGGALVYDALAAGSAASGNVRRD